MIHVIRFWSVRMVIFAGLIGLPSVTAPAQQTTQPSAAGHRSGPLFIVERLRRAVSQLDLTDEQKTKVNEIFDQASQQAQELSQSLENISPSERYQKMGAFVRGLRQQLAAVLTDAQLSVLRRSLGPGPTSRPGGGDFPGGGMLENFQQAVAKLDLSPDQQQQIKEIMESFLQKARALRDNAGDDVQAQMQKLRQNLRNKLQSILTSDQMQTLMQTLQQLRQERSVPTTRPHEQTSQSPGARLEAVAVEPDQPPSAEVQPPALDVGSAVPNVKIIELNGRAFMPANYKGHILVLEFGSMSCPVFRDHVPEMEKLKSSEGPRAFFLIVYTREAFPAGDKDVLRNKDQNITIPQAMTLDERKAQARQTQDALGITIPMSVDSMDDAVSNAFGTFPNGVVVIGKDGKIAALEHWTNPDSLRRAIDQAFDAPDRSDH
ncbi:MAG TPA: deiodinase-like protein [Tepidisphaeraceae bacterium]|nr:deiodinase-like protein [Tepidisphaeraceae bacterium]